MISGLVFGPLDVTALDVAAVVLIPLISGLVFGHERHTQTASSVVLIPLISGLVFGRQPKTVTGDLLVLIPLISGLVFGRNLKRRPQRMPCLNPFDFRAGIWSARLRDYSSGAGLNPFDFRAGIWSWRDKALVLIRCLNPFDFRAGIWSRSSMRPSSQFVLIPLISGLVFGHGRI